MRFLSHFLNQNTELNTRWVYNRDGIDLSRERSTEHSFEIPDDELVDYTEDFQERYTQAKQTETNLTNSFNEGVLEQQALIASTGRMSQMNNQMQEALERHSGNIGLTEDALENFVESQALGSSAVDRISTVSFLAANNIQPSDPVYIRAQNVVTNLINQQRQVMAAQAALRQQSAAFTETAAQMRENSTALTELQPVLQELERERATQNIGLQLLSLQDEFDVNEDGVISVDEMPHHEQLAILSLVAGEESVADARLEDSRTSWGQKVDEWGRTVESLVPEWASNMARREIDSRFRGNEKAELVSMLSADVVAEFIRFEPERAKDFFSDQVGYSSYRLDFMGNDYAEANIGLTDLLTADQRFARIQSDTGEIFYAHRDTRNGLPGYFDLSTDLPVDVDTNFIVTGLGHNPEREDIQMVLANRETPLPEYSAVDQSVAEYEHQLASAESRLVNRIADVTTRRVYTDFFNIEIGTEVTDADHEAFLNAAETRFGNLSFFEGFSTSYQSLQAQLVDPSNFENWRGEPISASARSLRVTEIYEAFYEETGGQMRQTMAELRASDDPAARRQLEEIGTLMNIVGEAQSEVLISQASTLQDKSDRIRATLIDRYRFNNEQVDQLNEFLANNSRFSNQEIVEFLANSLGRPGFRVNEDGTPNRRLMSLLHDLGTIQHIQGESEALHARVEVQRMQQFMGMLAFDSDVQAFVRLVNDDLDASEQALLQSIYAGEILDPRDHLPQLNTLAVAISEQAIPEAVDHTFANILRNGQHRMITFVGGTVTAAANADEATAASQTAYENAEATTEVAGTFEETPDAVRAVAAAIGPEGELDPNVGALFNDPNTDFSPEAVDRIVNLIESDAYAQATPESRAQMFAATTDQPVNLVSPDEALVAEFNVNFPPGVNNQIIQVAPDGSVTATFETQNIAYQVDQDGGIIGTEFSGVAAEEREDLITNNWPLAQFYAATCSGNITQGLARMTAQGAENGGQESMGDAMANLMADTFRDPNYTFTPNQINQCQQLGQRMVDYDLRIDQVFAALGGGYSVDGTINTSQVMDGTKFIALLEASLGDYPNQAFEDLLGLNKNSTDGLA